MAPIKKGNRVKVYYTGKHKDGMVFETNIGQPALEFIVGKGKVIKGFENAVIGMELGQTKTVTFKPADAYGAKDPALILVLSAGEFPAGMTIAQGIDISLTRADGTPVEGRVTKIEGEQITVDGNHPLAGRSLTFDIKIVGIG